MTGGSRGQETFLSSIDLFADYRSSRLSASSHAAARSRVYSRRAMKSRAKAAGRGRSHLILSGRATVTRGSARSAPSARRTTR